MTMTKKFIRSEFCEKFIDEPIPQLDKKLLDVLSYFEDRISTLNLSQQFLFDKFRIFHKDMDYFEKKINTPFPVEGEPQKVATPSSIDVCPLCGDNAFIRLGQPQVTCHNDYCRFSGPLKGTHEEAINSWNVIVEKIRLFSCIAPLLKTEEPKND